MSRRLRLLGVSAIVAGVAGAAIPATASAVPVITMSGSTSVAPLASLLAKAYLKQYPGRVKFKLAQGGSDVGVADVAAGRVTIGNSSRDPKDSRSGRPGLQQDRQGRDLHRHQPGQHARATCRRTQIQAIFSGQVRNWEDVPGAGTTGSINLVVRTAASGTQDAFQKIFMGIEDRVQRRLGEGLQRPRPADRADRQERDRLRVAGLRQGHQRRLLPGRRLHAGRRQVRRVRRRAQLLDGHPRAPARGQRAAEVHPLGPDLREGARRSSPRTGCRSSRCSTGSESRGRTSAPSGCSARWRLLVLLLIVLMIVFVAVARVAVVPAQRPVVVHRQGRRRRADRQPGQHRRASPTAADYQLGAWPLIWGTVLTTGFAVVFGLVFAVLAAIFIVEFAPDRLRRVIVPVVRLLAAVPSVIYGLIGILVLVPFVNDHLVSEARKKSVQYVINLSGTGLLVSIVILTVMITPIMIAIIVDALYAVPRGWKEGAAALGVNRWRAMWTVSVRAARPAIIAAAVLACARALGEAIMLSMVSGSKGFAPNPADGLTFLFEPLRPLASTIVEDAESLNAPAVQAVGLLVRAAAAVLEPRSCRSAAGWPSSR